MPVTLPFSASRLLPPGRRLVPICAGLSALALAASVILAGLPIAAGSPSVNPGMVAHVGFWPVLQQLLPLLAAVFGLLSGVLGMLFVSGAASPAAGAPGDTTGMPGLQGVVRQLTGLLEEEHRQIAAFQEIYGNSTREALVVSRRLALLADVALDAETRLVAGVAQAEEALRQPGGPASGVADGSSHALPEITDIIRRSILDQSRAIASTLDAMSARLVSEADGPVQTFRVAVAGVSDQIRTLGDTAATLSRDVIAFETAGRGIATIGATVVSRVNDAVVHIDAALAQLPEAAASVIAATEQAALNLVEASDALRIDSAAVAASGHQIQQAAVAVHEEADALQSTRQGILDAATTTQEEAHALQAMRQGIMDAASAVHEETSALQQARHGMTEAATAVHAEAATLQAVRQGITEAVAAVHEETYALQETRHGMTEAATAVHAEAATLQAVRQGITEAVAAVHGETHALQETRHSVAEAATAVHAEAAALQAVRQGITEAVAAVHDETSALQETRQDIAEANGAILSQIDSGLVRIDAALGQLPAVAEAIVASAERAEHGLADASRRLGADSANLAAAGHETLQAAERLRQDSQALKAAGQEIADAGHQTIAFVAQTVETAVAQLGAVIADADAARQGSTGLAELAETLENAAATLVDGAYSLDAAGTRVAIAGEKVTERFVIDSVRNNEMLQGLPDVTASMVAAMEALRVETSVLTAAAQQVSSAGYAAMTAVTDVAARVEVSAASLDTTGRMISVAGHEVAAQIGHLSEIAGYAEMQASQLPAVAADIAAASARLQAVTEAWRPDAMLTILPEAAARLDAAGPRLDQLDGLSQRLEAIVAGLEAGQGQDAAVATMAVLSTDIGEAVRRVEAALADHEGAWPAVVASIEQIQTAVIAVTQAAAEERMLPGADARLDGLPATLAATLRHFDGVASESEMLLQQTEALAEAVLSGQADNLSPLLVDRAPALLAGIETTTQRLRSVATALALASDGKPALERRVS